MARLLTLALAETTSSANGYDVIAWDEDGGSWVKLHVPMGDFVRGNKPVWDIFGWTEATISKGWGHPEHRLLMEPQTAKLIGHIRSLEERKAWLDRLTDQDGLFWVYQQGRYVGLLKPSRIEGIKFGPKPGRMQRERTIAWRASIPFSDGNRKWEGRCKDMRWKRYWVDILERRPEQGSQIAGEWLTYLQQHATYFIFSCWDWAGRSGDFEPGNPRMYAITGVHCLPVPRD